MEKEKLVLEHQERVESLRDKVKTMATRQVTLKRQKRRAEITVAELTKLKADHVVYQGVGRAFVRMPVNKLIDSNNELVEKCEAEDSRLVNEKQRAAEAIVKEEGELRNAAMEYRAAFQLIQAVQSQNQGQSQGQQQQRA